MKSQITVSLAAFTLAALLTALPIAWLDRTYQNYGTARAQGTTPSTKSHPVADQSESQS